MAEQELEQKLLVWGDPAGGFTYMGPMTPGDPAMEEWIDIHLRDEYWWYVNLKPPAWPIVPVDDELADA